MASPIIAVPHPASNPFSPADSTNTDAATADSASFAEYLLQETAAASSAEAQTPEDVWYVRSRQTGSGVSRYRPVFTSGTGNRTERSASVTVSVAASGTSSTTLSETSSGAKSRTAASSTEAPVPLNILGAWIRQRLERTFGTRHRSVSDLNSLWNWSGRGKTKAGNDLFQFLSAQTERETANLLAGLSVTREQASELTMGRQTSLSGFDAQWGRQWQEQLQMRSIKIEVSIEQAEQLVQLNDSSWTGSLEVRSASVMISSFLMFADPVVLDMNGDGLHLRGAEDGVSFDMAGTGTRQQTGFVRGDDALLYLDRDGNGLLDDGKELFGDQEGDAHGFAELSKYDGNGDGWIDASDAAYDELKVFQDWNSDGVNQPDESRTLVEAGVERIAVASRATHEVDAGGNIIGRAGAFVCRDGSEGRAYDIWFGLRSSGQT